MSAKRRVLIADDDPDSAESLAMLLAMEGHEVLTVNDGAEALRAFDTFRPEFALLDIGMPTLSGYEVAEAARARGSRPAVLIAVTGWGQQDDRERALGAGFDHHFTKPVEPERLLALLGAPPSGRSE